MITNITQKQIRKLVSNDELRPSMKGIFYQPEDSIITVTDGHKLVSFNVTPEDDDIECIIPLEVFPALVGKKELYRYTFKDKIVSRINLETDLIIHQAKLIDEKYPNYKAIVENMKNYDAEIKEVCFSIENMIDLLSSIKDHNTLIEFHIKNPARGILFKYGDMEGLIMPMIKT